MVTSTTVGYGDISPLSVSAVWIVIVHHLASIILLIAVVTQLASFSGTQSDDAYAQVSSLGHGTFQAKVQW